MFEFKASSAGMGLARDRFRTLWLMRHWQVLNPLLDEFSEDEERVARRLLALATSRLLSIQLAECGVGALTAELLRNHLGILSELADTETQSERLLNRAAVEHIKAAHFFQRELKKVKREAN